MGKSNDLNCVSGTSGGLRSVSIILLSFRKDVLNRSSQQTYASETAGGPVRYSSSTALSSQQCLESKDRVKEWLKEPGKEAPWNPLTIPKNGIEDAMNAADARNLGYAGERRPRL